MRREYPGGVRTIMGDDVEGKEVEKDQRSV